MTSTGRGMEVTSPVEGIELVRRLACVLDEVDGIWGISPWGWKCLVRACSGRHM